MPERREARRGGPLLFDPEELDLRRTGTARLAALARRRKAVRTARERKADEDRDVIGRLRTWGAELADRFGLQFTVIEAEQEGVTEYYGICYEDGVIRIRLRHARTGRVLKESSLVDTLCHELAHLRHLNHGAHFRRLYQRIIATARRQGYYRPGPAEPVRPRQRSLFDVADCGIRGG